ncbi:MAG: threonine-phosphate decarboxylase CobD [Thermincolia bacterium]
MEEIQHIHGGDIRAAAEEFGLKEEDILDFSANINPLGPSPRVREVIMENFHQVVNYPDPNCTTLRAALGRKFGLETKQIVMGNGAVELIYLLMKLLTPRKVLIPAPTFGEYEIGVVCAHGQVVDLPLDSAEGFPLNVEKVVTQLSRVDMVIICNPNNPTGKLVEREDIETIIREAEETGAFVLVDEAFMDFVDEPERYSVVDLVHKYSNLMVLYSMTKFYGIPGLRLGAAFGNPRIIGGMTAMKDPWNVNCFAQLAGVVSLEDEDYRSRTRIMVREAKKELYHNLVKIPGLKVNQPSVNYIFLDVSGTGYPSTRLKELLARQGILVRDCSSYKNLGSDYIRVAVKDQAANSRLVEALTRLTSVKSK